MQDLRLIGVHEDGEHVLLSDAEGKRYRVALDEAMRAAARRDRPRLGQLQIEIDGGLRPRDVQSLIRSGLSTEEVADRAGWTIQKVQRFEGPVLAEREYVANQARNCVVGTHAGSGRNAGTEQTLGGRADERFKARGVPGELVRWDSARLDDGQWTVTALFPAGGRERTASWRFDPRLRSLVPGNDEARWLSEQTSADSAIPTPHVATNSNRASAVFDVEAEGGVDAEKPARRNAKSREPIDLMAAMREQSTRSRKGRRRPSPSHTPVEDSPRDDALPLEDLVVDTADAPEPPAARGKHPISAHLDDQAPEDDEADVELDEEDDAADNIRQLTPSAPDEDEQDDEPDEPEDELEDIEPEPEPVAPKPTPRKTSGRKGRPSVPSWDDIMFGGGGRGGTTT
ncbi:putative DNA-binding protein [Janibacter sp. HTCC2649]|uniref:septation protein SepH n=1 Tax=Janibacter sp. HTCC2649 TaxID=313589 RepID=UPI000066EA4C|nr:septation protein SepH [Janibacter sp. HTCC2649]EAP98858.1 putative DNA-binding protein [Janibacter sp. HTCC2649]